MKILFYNIRGLRRGVKWAAIRKLVRKERVDMMCLQETKKELVDKASCQALWGDSDISWAIQPANNSAGGILCIRSEHVFKLEKKCMDCGSQRQQDERSIKEFNEWIADLEVDDVTCVGRKYTWYRPNGKAKSRLDRFLVSADWFNKCQDNCQFILQRNFSDHCPILLRSSNVVWGPKPFRVLDCWF